MGCCESSNRRKVDELNASLGTVYPSLHYLRSLVCVAAVLMMTFHGARRSNMLLCCVWKLAQTIQDQMVPLMSEAAFKGDVTTMQRLVGKGASVNQHDQVQIASLGGTQLSHISCQVS